MTPQAAAASIRELRRRRMHPHFAGYLCLLHAATAAGRTQEIKVNFKQFFGDFLVYGNASKMRPYINPFSRTKEKGEIYFNRNVAGSYAPKSIRPGQPLAQVVSAYGSGSDARYTLAEAHPSAALKHLLYGQRLPIILLSVFLYRDYGFKREVGGLIHEIFVTEFRNEFGFGGSGDGAAAFSELFDTHIPFLGDGPIAERVDANGGL